MSVFSRHKTLSPELISSLCLCLSAICISYTPRLFVGHVLFWGWLWQAVYLASRRSLGESVARIFSAAIPYFGLWLYLWSNVRYTNDLEGHVGYINYLHAHFPWDINYRGREHWHPPFYHIVASYFEFWFRGHFDFAPLTGARLFSLPLYMCFCYFGLRTLMLYVSRQNRHFYIACMLVVFWPVSISMATRINNDIALYAVWSPWMYYLSLWYKTGRTRRLYIAICLTGLAFCVKTNAIVLLASLGVMLLCGLYQQKLQFRQLFQKPFLLCFTTIALGMMMNVIKPLYVTYVLGKDGFRDHLGYAHYFKIAWHDYFILDVANLVKAPTVYGFYNFNMPAFFVKTLSLPEASLDHLWLASVMNVAMLTLLLCTAAGLLLLACKNRAAIAELLPCIVTFLLGYCAITAFCLIKQWDVCMDARFIYPVIVSLVICYVRAMDMLAALPQLSFIYQAGLLAGRAIPLLAMVFYPWQYL
jgi:hypothetical protein